MPLHLSSLSSVACFVSIVHWRLDSALIPINLLVLFVLASLLIQLIKYKLQALTLNRNSGRCKIEI